MRNLPLLLLLFFASCNDGSDTSTVPDTDHALMVETADTAGNGKTAGTAYTADQVTVDTTDLSPAPDTPIKILLDGTFHKQEVWKNVQQQQWLALTFENGNYTLQPAHLSVRPAYDAAIDPDSMHISGREIVSNTPNTVLYIAGLDRYNKGIIDTASFSRDVIAPDRQLELSFKDKTYTLKAFGDSVATEGADYYNIKNYGWKVSGIKKGRKIEQVISEDASFDQAIYVLLWAGDLDSDGIPDIVADLSNHYNATKITLFLSSKAPKGKLYKKVATFEFLGS